MQCCFRLQSVCQSCDSLLIQRKKRSGYFFFFFSSDTVFYLRSFSSSSGHRRSSNTNVGNSCSGACWWVQVNFVCLHFPCGPGDGQMVVTALVLRGN